MIVWPRWTAVLVALALPCTSWVLGAEENNSVSRSGWWGGGAAGGAFRPRGPRVAPICMLGAGAAGRAGWVAGLLHGDAAPGDGNHSRVQQTRYVRIAVER